MRQYIIVNESLSMSPGKVAAQVAHASVGYAMQTFHMHDVGWRYNDMIDWFEVHGQRKIVVNSGETSMEEYARLLSKDSIDYHEVIERVFNERPEKYVTALAVEPLPDDEIPKWFAKLRLL